MEKEDFSDDEVFLGPVTARELEITWRKRRTYNLHHNSKSLAETNNSGTRSILIQDLNPVNTVHPVQKPPGTTSTILKPPKLVVNHTGELKDIKWAKTINMKKIVQPQRPGYVSDSVTFNTK